MRRKLIGAGIVALVGSLLALAVACGDGNGTERPRVEISAETSISFSTDRLQAAAGQSFTVVFDNRDGTEPHNFEIYTDDSASDQIAATDVETGPTMQELDVPALDAGEYYFRCSVHPTDMTGTLIVQEEAASTSTE